MGRNRRVSRFVVVCAAVLALCGLVAAGAAARPAPQTEPGDVLDPRTYAPESQLFLVAHAEGTQTYTCTTGGTWSTASVPDATLYETNGADAQPKVIGMHFLNLLTGRPVWQLKDGSSAEAARYAAAAGGTGNIAWLLLQAVATTPGSDGSRLTQTTWIQRLNTVGGVAPSGACTPGATVAVGYSADYFFWRAVGGA